jgi:hypothetical protein
MPSHLGEKLQVPTSNELGKGVDYTCWYLSPPIRMGDDPIGI